MRHEFRNRPFHAIDGRLPLFREVFRSIFRSIPNVHDGAICDETFLIFPIRSPSRRDDWGYLATAHAFPALLLLCMSGEPCVFSARRFVGRSRSHGFKLDGFRRNVRGQVQFAIDDFGRFETAAGTVSPSEEFVPGHFPSVHCGAICGKTFLMFPIRSRSRSEDSRRKELREFIFTDLMAIFASS